MAERLTDHELDNYNDPGCQNCSDYCWRSCKEDDAVKDCAQRLIYNRLAAYEDLGTVEELAALKEAAERIVLMWDNCYIETYSADVKDYIERMRKAIKEADNDESGN